MKYWLLLPAEEISVIFCCTDILYNILPLIEMYFCICSSSTASVLTTDAA